MDSAILVVLVAVFVPLLLARSKGRRSADGRRFRSSLRALYPGISIICIVLDYFYIRELWLEKRQPKIMDWVTIAAVLALVFIAVFSWPASVYATPEGLRWRRLFIRRFIPWSEIQAAYTGMEGDMVIITTGNQRYELTQYTEGILQLKGLIKTKLTELRGPDVCVR